MWIQDTGRFVGRYFQVLGWCSIALSVLSPLLQGGVHIDLTCILYFVLGHYLIRHHHVARILTLVLTGLLLATVFGLVCYGTLVTTAGMAIEFGPVEIGDPTVGQLLMVAAVMLVLIGGPFVLLLTPQARREFASRPVTVAGSA